MRINSQQLRSTPAVIISVVGSRAAIALIVFLTAPQLTKTALGYPQIATLAYSNNGKSNDRQSDANQAQEKPESRQRSKNNSSDRASKEASSAGSRNPKQPSEREVLQFVSKHQPELVKMLEFLGTDKQRARYDQALREIARTKLRLEALQKRDQEMFVIELELWKLDSQLRLLAAQIGTLTKKKERTTAEQQLEELVAKHQAKTLEKLKLQRKRARSQLERLENQIRERESSPDELLSRSLKVWQNRIVKQTPKSKIKRNTDSK
ncbi:MAG: hypothetical protein AAF483_21735 [Planctomycetota bacterium]